MTERFHSNGNKMVNWSHSGGLSCQENMNIPGDNRPNNDDISLWWYKIGNDAQKSTPSKIPEDKNMPEGSNCSMPFPPGLNSPIHNGHNRSKDIWTPLRTKDINASYVNDILSSELGNTSIYERQLSLSKMFQEKHKLDMSLDHPRLDRPLDSLKLDMPQEGFKLDMLHDRGAISKPSPVSYSGPSSSASTSSKTSVRYLSDSLSYLVSMNNTPTNINKRRYTVIKVVNIPWCVSAADIKTILSKHENLIMPDTMELAQNIHIIMDIRTGKTCGTAFVEVHNTKSIDAILKDINSPLPLQGRRLRHFSSSYDELFKHLFPGWRGKCENGQIIPPDTQDVASIDEYQDPLFFINQKDLQSLVNVCRNYKIYYNRKCGERPFEFLISILLHIPWDQPKVVTTIQRDLIYECYKLVTEKPFHPFSSDLLLRMVRAALQSEGFTPKQKNGILDKAKMTCPLDLLVYINDLSNPAINEPIHLNEI
ncbi:hypothetical protein BDB01DRAFT_830601 [Pilobolus umbonatus]|nr:hypothetical protein BDB01DRAFT_830601 [Pilobolus umbonatus]